MRGSLRCRWGFGAIFVAALSVAPVARAEPKDDARREFVAGLDAASRGDYRAALGRFLAAQQLYPHPSTMFNIAKAYADLGEVDAAIGWLEDYRARVGTPAAPAESLMTELLARRAERPQPPVVVEAPPVPAGTAPPVVDARIDRVLEELAALRADMAALRAPAPEPASALPGGPGGGQGDDPVRGTRSGEATVGEDGLLGDPYAQVVYSASRYGQSALDAPNAVTVLTAAEIVASGATNLGDALRRVVGVDVMSLVSGTPEVGIRGFNSELSNKVLVLIDGRTIQWEFIGSEFWTNLPIGVDDVDRIEIIRGPASAVYGANAVTGVINILTRLPERDERRLRVSAGTPGVLSLSGSAGGVVGGTGYRLSAGVQQEGRWASQGPIGAEVALVPDPTLSTRSVRVNAQIERRFLGKGVARAQAGFSQGFFEYYNIGALGNFAADARSHFVRGDLAWGPVRLRSFWNRDVAVTGPWSQARDTSRSLNSPLQSDVVDVEALANPEIVTGEVRHRLGLGLGWRYKGIRFGYLEGGYDRLYPEHHFAGFVQDQASWRWLSVAASFRVDRHPLIPIDQTLSPRAALIFRVAPKTAVRASAASAFRAPNAVENYMSFELPTSADGVYLSDYGGQNNPNGQALRPERILAAELGVHDESSLLHRADISVYYNRVSDIIRLSDVTPVTNAVGASGFEAGWTGWANQPQVYHSVGIEADASVFPVRGLDLFANAALQRIFEQSGGDSVVDGSTSSLRANLGGTWRTPWATDLSLSLHYRSAQAWRLREFDSEGRLAVDVQGIPGRVVGSARVAVRPLVRHDLEIAGTLWNPSGFWDPQREHPKGQPVGGRAYVTVSYGF